MSSKAIEIKPTRGLPSLNLRELWDAREVLFILAWRDVKVRYKQTVLGVAWAVLQPLLMMLVFSVFLGLLAKVPSSGGLPYPLFVIGGLVPWIFIAAILSQGSQCLVENEALLTKVYFPRLLIPGAAVLAALVDFAFALLVLVGMMVFYGHPPGASALLVPLCAVFALVVASGLTLWLSAVNVRYRDVRYTTAFLTQILFYISPIAYPSTVVPERFRAIYGLNPIAGVVESFKAAVLGTPYDAGLIAVSLAVGLVLVVTGWLYFRQAESSFADVI
jgi:lipopolysaccharide transport system permease protein